jgi:hypothetical protein
MTPPQRLHLSLATALVALAGIAGAQGVPPGLAPGAGPAAAPAQQPAPSVSTQAPMRVAQARTAPAARAESKPAWNELSAQQQQSLAPLAGTWRRLGEAHKRKWLALSANYPTMAPAEQALLHSRMAEWAALSPQQRTLARLNFAETKAVAPTDKKAKWEAYQALPPEEKRRLAAGAAAAKPVPPPTAPALKPVPQQKLARIPKPRKPDSTAKIAVVPGQVDRNTLLPQPGLAPIPPAAPAPQPATN